jgi:subtilisin family serine protease
MNHPDLATNTVAGWDAVTGEAILQSPGISHSTAGAGMVAGVINNGIGIAGAGRCGILPINVTGFVSEMYNAVVWAADHGVRVVNISWSGGNEPTLETAGAYLETQARGLLVMSGVNGAGFLDYTNQPHIYCVSMTDAADNLQSHYGNHIDFAAPGYAVPTTTIGSSYTTATGTSFSAPLFSGVAAVLLGINPTLSPSEVIEILRTTADDLGPAGWDMYFGWGRIHFGRAAAAAQATLPHLQPPRLVAGIVELTATFRTGLTYSLWRTPVLAPANWQPVVPATATTNGSSITFSDTPPSGLMHYYRITVDSPPPG